MSLLDCWKPRWLIPSQRSGYGNEPQSTGSSHLGRDAAIGAGALGAGTAAHHHHHDRERDVLGSDTDRAFPLGGQSATTSGSEYPSGSTTRTAGTTAGPHSSSLANKADPRVDSDRDGSKVAGHHTGYGSTSTGYGSGTGPSTGATHQGTLERDGGLAAATGAGSGVGYGAGSGTGSGVGSGVGYGPESWKHDHGTHGHKFEGDPCAHGEAVPGPHFTTGPHITDTANRLDPHVASGIGEPTATTHTDSGSGLGSTSRSGDHHHGRDAALAGGAGAAGIGAYESSRDHSGSATEPTTTSTGPHKSSLLNKLDPRVPSGPSKEEGLVDTTTSSRHPESSGLTGSSTAGTSDLPSSQTTGRDHHYGRDAGLVGAGGVAGYEAEKHLRGSKQTGTTSTGVSDPYTSSGIDPRVDSKTSSGLTGSTDPTRSGKDHHYGRDAGLGGLGGLAGTGGAGAYEADKHLGKDAPPSKSSGLAESTGGSAYNTRGPTGTVDDSRTGTDHHHGRDAGIAGIGAGSVAAYEAKKHHDRSDPTTTTGSSSYAPTGYNDREQSSSSHTGRDAALAGGAGAGLGAGGVAAYEAKRHHDRSEPTTTTDSSSYAPTGYNDREKTSGSHPGRDTALAGGAGAGSGAASGAEFSKKEAEKLEKQQHKEIEKEQKAIHKDQAKHEKTIEKEEKKHEKALAKEEKKHDDGKKHGGILGLFHRDKSDKDLKEEELERRNAGSHHGAVGAGVADHEKHERNRLHKDPPEGYGSTTSYADPPQDGYASQVTGGTGTTALAQGQEVSEGSHLTGIGNKVDPK